MAHLKIVIGAVTKGLTAGLNRAKGGIKQFAGFVKNNFAIIAAVITGTVFAMDRLATSADNIAKSSKRIGLDPAEFERIAFAAERTGSGMDKVEVSFKRMQRTINDAKDLESARKGFDGIGVSWQKLQGMAPGKQFQIIARALSKVTDSTKRAGVAQEIFGRAGTSIAPLIKEYDKLSERFDELGGPLSKDAIRAAEEYKDAITDLQISAKKMATEGGMIEFLKDAVNWTTNALVAWNKYVNAIGKFSEKTFGEQRPFEELQFKFQQGEREAKGLERLHSPSGGPRLSEEARKKFNDKLVDPAAFAKRKAGTFGSTPGLGPFKADKFLNQGSNIIGKTIGGGVNTVEDQQLVQLTEIAASTRMAAKGSTRVRKDANVQRVYKGTKLAIGEG